MKTWMTCARISIGWVLCLALLGWLPAAEAVVAFKAAAESAIVDNKVVVNVPAGTVSGDVMVAHIVYRATTTVTLTPPAGWTQIGTLLTTAGAGGSTPLRQAIYYRVATAAEPASYQWSISAVRRVTGMIATFSGVHTTTPINVFSQQTGSGTSIVAPSLTTT